MAWRVARDSSVKGVYCVPGNAGIAADVSCISGNILNINELSCLAEFLEADLTVVGPEAPLVEGVADEFAARGFPIVGPSQDAARLEGSKVFARGFLVDCGIPRARFGHPDDIRGLAVFLASDSSSWITGALIPMDGGNLAMNAGGSYPGGPRASG